MTSQLSPGMRRAVASVAGPALVGLLVVALLPARHDVSVATPALVLLVPGIVAGILGGRVAALVTATVAALALDVVFIEPYGTLDVHLVDDVVALVTFVAVAITVATLLSLATERSRLVDRHAAELVTLERAGDAQRALLRSVSHDLRTPLAAIRAVTTDLRDGSAAYDEPTRRELLDVVSDEAERLDRLVANLLSLSRVEAGALAPQRQAVDLDEMIADRVRRLSRVLRDVRVEPHVPEGLPLVDADYTLLDQVLTNLLENAARHSPHDGTIRIEARALDDAVEVAVSDEGPGVPAADRAWVFEPFRSGQQPWPAAAGPARETADQPGNGSRAGNANRAGNGAGAGSRAGGGTGTTGIGLAICKAIVEAHGGCIAVTDTAGGRGARFAFTLPVHRARPQPAEPPETAAPVPQADPTEPAEPTQPVRP